MKNIRYVLISSIMLFLVMTGIHFVYDCLNLDIIAILFPTNESIFQHMKMIFTSFFIYNLILFFIKRRWNLNNIFLTNLISVAICIVFFLIIYLPIRFRFGDNMIFTFILLFISILLGQYLSHSFLKKENLYSLDILSLIVILIILFILAYFTFNPLHNDIFWDPEHETYKRVTE